MMGGATMSDNLMAGCAGTMQSMNNGGDGRRNSEWRRHPSQGPDYGG